MRDGGQDLHALLQVRLDALLHVVEGNGGAHHFARAVFGQRHGGAVGTQRIGRIGQRAQGPRGRAHGPGTQAHQQRQLQRQRAQHPRRYLQSGLVHVHGQGCAVGQAQLQP